MMFRPRRALVASAVTVAALALAGCGGSDEEAGSPSTSAGDASTSSTPTTAVEEDQGQASGGGSGDLAKVMSKSFAEGKSAHIVMDMGGQGSGEGDISFDGEQSAMDLTMSIAGQDAEMRLVDGTMYVQQAAMGGKWIKIDVAQMGGGAPIPDPSELVKQLESTTADATEVEDGHWRFKQDTGSADLWVGDDGYIEKMTATIDGAGEITMTYSDWGKDVKVKAPAAGDVMEIPGGAPGMPGGAS